MRTWRYLGAFLLGGFLVGMYGCASVQNSLISGATSGLARAVSERAEQGLYNRLAPKTKLPQPKTPGWNQFMTLQAQIIFNYTFSAGGLWISTTGYQPGEFTKFEFKGADDAPVTLERAFLRNLDDGREWWRVSWSDTEGTWVYEALLTSGANAGQIVRLRGKDYDGNEGEIPVTGDQMVYTAPTQVSPESIQGATKGRETISTPAGSHVVSMAASGEGNMDWWITGQVPGGVAKYSLNDKSEGTVWTSTLTQKGTNAATILSSFWTPGGRFRIAVNRNDTQMTWRQNRVIFYFFRYFPTADSDRIHNREELE